MTTIDNLIKSALETGLDCAQDIAHQVHEQYKGYKPHRHVAVDADVAQIKAALEALAKDGYLIGEGSKAQTVREPLTDDVIFEIACGAADEMWPDVGGVGWTKDDAKFYGIFCKKIERAHGIGGAK